MKLHQELIKHLDHGLSAQQLAYLLLRYEGRDAFFKESITLPAEFGTVPVGLYGPIMGDKPIPSAHVAMMKRGDRKYPSRRLVGAAVERFGYPRNRRTSEASIIAGPYDGLPCVLYTAFGGPLTPREVDDPTLPEAERPESIAFWSEHALYWEGA